MTTLSNYAGVLNWVSNAVVDGSSTGYANFGAKEETEYEIGSITKTFTGFLLANAMEQGEVTAQNLAHSFRSPARQSPT